MNLKELRDKVANLPTIDDAKPPHWDYWRADMRDNLLNRDPSTFCEWPVIRHTMLMDHLPIDKSIEIVQANLQRYAYAISQPKWVLSHGDGYGINNMYSRTMAEQCAHIAMWETHSGKKLEELSHIIEFGGGFGAMALLVHRLGFTGQYTVFDFPEMTYLQDWFLEENDITGVEFVSEIEGYYIDADMLIAIDSLSETPMEFRKTFLYHVNADNLIFRYSPIWGNYDNDTYFDKLTDVPRAVWEAEGWVSKSMVCWQ